MNGVRSLKPYWEHLHYVLVTESANVSNEDVLGLRGVGHLELRHCQYVTDKALSALSELSTLTLFGCARITGTGLSALNHLTLSKCSLGNEGLSALGQVQTLSLFHCNNITDISALGGVDTLDINH